MPSIAPDGTEFIYKGSPWQSIKAGYSSRWDPRIVLLYIRRAARTWAMLIVLMLRPSLSSRLARGRFPAVGNRIVKTSDPREDFTLLQERCVGISKMESATIVLRGASFDPSALGDLKSPIYLVNWREPVATPGVYYATADSLTVAGYHHVGQAPIFIVHGSWLDERGQEHGPNDPLMERAKTDAASQHVELRYNVRMSSPPKLGSGLMVVLALSMFTERLDVYGWDFYMAAALREQGNFTQLRRIADAYYYPESTLYNLHYAHRLAQLPGVHLHGHLGDLSADSKLARALDGLLYRAPFDRTGPDATGLGEVKPRTLD
jgi:hypothetical protein